MSPISARTITESLRSHASTDKANNLSRFFKTGKGQYGEGDKFMGIVVPDVRKVAKEYHKQVTLSTIEQLVKSPYHEVRLCALIMLVYKYQQLSRTSLRPCPQCSRTSEAGGGETTKQSHLLKKEIYNFYVSHTKHINNWDLVDLTAPNIVGDFLLRTYSSSSGLTRGSTSSVLLKLAKSASLWERRIAILSTFAFIRAKRHQEAFVIAELLLHDKHDLIHKAVGWMLREVGKRVGKDVLRKFLDTHASTMPRTALRYAIEHMEKEEREKYMRVKPILVNLQKIHGE